MTTIMGTDAASDNAAAERRRSRKLSLAGAVVLAGAAIATIPLTNGHHTSSAHQHVTAYESACGLSGGSTSVPTAAPQVQWQNLDGSWLPVSTTQGPGNRSVTDPWTCYAHTPTGAVLAAWGIPAGMTSERFDAAVRAQTLPGAGQAALLNQGPMDIPAAQLPTPIGFKLNAYDGGSATVTVYARQGGSKRRCTSTVEWLGGAQGDWVVRLTPDGSARSNCELVADDSSAGEFIAWGPDS